MNQHVCEHFKTTIFSLLYFRSVWRTLAGPRHCLWIARVWHNIYFHLTNKRVEIILEFRKGGMTDGGFISRRGQGQALHEALAHVVSLVRQGAGAGVWEESGIEHKAMMNDDEWTEVSNCEWIYSTLSTPLQKLPFQNSNILSIFKQIGWDKDQRISIVDHGWGHHKKRIQLNKTRPYGSKNPQGIATVNEQRGTVRHPKGNGRDKTC